MLTVMREKASSWVIKIILGAIVVVFIFWGVGSFRSARLVSVAKVDGKPITIDEYQKTYQNLIERYRQQFGNGLNEDMIKMLGLKRQALNQLIDQHVLLQEAKKLDLQVSDDQLAEFIQAIPAFQRGGKFDNRVYAQTLTLNHLSPEEFEFLQRDSIVMDHLRTYIMETVRVSDGEARAWFDWQNTQISLDYVHFSPDAFSDVTLTPEAKQKFFEENRNNYKTEPKARAQYIRIRPSDITEGVNVTDEEVQSYYDAHRADYQSPATVHARHILLKLEPGSKPETVEEKRKKAEEIMKEARSGSDFAELAKKYSEDTSKDAGGDLGTFTKETMVKPFAEKAFSMKPGEISDPVRTQFGWHIIKVEAVNPESVKELATVKEEVHKKLSLEKAKALANERIEAIYENLYEGDNLKSVADEGKYPVQESGLFTQAGPPDVGEPARFAAIALSLDVMQFSEVKDFSDGYYIIQVLEKQAEAPAEFPAVEEKVTADLKKKLQDEKARAATEAALEAWKQTADKEEPKPFPNEIKTTGLFKRNAEIQGIGRGAEILRIGFTLSEAKPVHEQVIKAENGYYLIRLKEKKAPEEAEFEKEKAQLKRQIVRQKQFETFNTWLGQLRGTTEIEIEEKYLE